MANLYSLFRELLPSAPLLVGTVLSEPEGGQYLIALPSGHVHRVRGVATVGQRVFFRNGVVEGPAPELPTELIEV